MFSTGVYTHRMEQSTLHDFRLGKTRNLPLVPDKNATVSRGMLILTTILRSPYFKDRSKDAMNMKRKNVALVNLVAFFFLSDYIKNEITTTEYIQNYRDINECSITDKAEPKH
jgi:hypothetical protein